MSADALPTAQMDGVAWDQVVVGNTVYVTGRFGYARPAGTAATSSQRVVRNNLLAYDLTTGNLITSFNHSLNGQGRVITASPDGSRIYVGGDFTAVDGLSRQHIAAFDTATGGLSTAFAPSISSNVLGLTASNSTVYAGGDFTTAGGASRSRLAAFSAGNGSLATWNPGANANVYALQLSPDGSRVIAGGPFSTLAGQTRLGIGSVLTADGTAGTWPSDFPILDYGGAAWINSLSTDGTNVFGSAYQFTQGGNFEGRFAVAPNTGKLIWMNSCHGDSYDTTVVNGVVYSASHEHDCSDIGSFNQDDPGATTSTHHFLAAETTNATGTALHPIFTGGPGQPGPRYTDFYGQPTATQLYWYPTTNIGSFTGQYQSAWTVAGNSTYLAVGGEFTTANGSAQQGLTRFAVRSAAPNQRGPENVTAPAATSTSSGSLRVSWRAASDQDNQLLTYQLYRDSGTTPIYTTTYKGAFFDRPSLGYVDSSITGSHTYRVRVTDPLGNTVLSSSSSAATVGSTALPSYPTMVRSDGASSLWRLNESSGSTGWDSIGPVNLALRSAVTLGAAGPITGQGTAASFPGTATTTTTGTPPRTMTTTTSDNVAASVGDVTALHTYSLEAWVKTTDSTGGVVVGDGMYAPDSGRESAAIDRVVYFNNDGKLYFGVFNAGGVRQTIGSANAYNDGAWHHVVATVGGSGAALFVDGSQVAVGSGLTDDGAFWGHWRIGGDSLTRWTPLPTDGYLAGSVADVAVYPTVLTTAQIQNHFAAAGGTVNPAPAAAFTSSCTDLACGFDASGSSDDGTITSYAWNFGDTATATGSTPNHTYGSAGTYQVTLTVTDNLGATGTMTKAVTVTAPPPGNTAPTAAFTSACTDLSCSFDAGGSTDADGTITGYSWDFGDGSSGTGATPNHPYATAGTYSVVLTVTDDDGAIDTETHTVSPKAPTPDVFAADTFGRTVAGGFGDAETGSSWTISPATRLSVNGSSGQISLPSAGSTETAYLGGVSSTSTDLTLTTALDKVPAGSSAYLDITGRRPTTNQEYNALVRIQNTGAVSVSIRKLNGSSTAVDVVSATTVSGLTYTAGTPLKVRFQVSGTSPTTLRAKVWPASSSEPSSWNASGSDSSSGLQVAGSIGVRTYLSSSVTNAPLVQTVDDLTARPVG